MKTALVIPPMGLYNKGRFAGRIWDCGGPEKYDYERGYFMSVLTDLIYAGTNAVIGLTEGAVNDAISKYGEDKPISFPDTAYFLPTIYAATGVKVTKLGDLPACVGVMKSLNSGKEELGEALNAGLATAVGAEILEALKFVDSAEPYAGDSGIGFVPDPVIRSLGVPLVTGDIPGVAVVLGEAEDAASVGAVVKDYQSKGILTFLVGGVIEQAAAEGVKMGLDFRVVPPGPRRHGGDARRHSRHPRGRSSSVALQPGDLAGLLKYTKGARTRVRKRVRTAERGSRIPRARGAIALGFPVIVDTDLGENQVPGALESVTDHSKTAAHSLELRGIKIKIKGDPHPRGVRGGV